MSELTVEATTENLAKVFSFIKAETENYCTPKAAKQIKLSVEEIYMNIANYAYDPEIGPARIDIEVVRDPEPVRVIISFMDRGRPFDPLKQDDPDTEQEDLEKRPVGGLGIYLVKQNMDGVTYEFKDGRNILTLRKELA